MKDVAAELAAWAEYGRAAIAALPPVNEDIDREVAEAVAAYHAKQPKRKLIIRQRVKP